MAAVATNAMLLTDARTAEEGPAVGAAVGEFRFGIILTFSHSLPSNIHVKCLHK